MSPLLARLISACEGAGYQILDEDKSNIEKAMDGFTDDTLNKLVTVFADQLPSGGVKNIEFGGIKSALISSEAGFDGVANQKIEQLYSALEQALLNAANARSKCCECWK